MTMFARRISTSRRTQACRTPKDEAVMGYVAETGRVYHVG